VTLGRGLKPRPACALTSGASSDTVEPNLDAKSTTRATTPRPDAEPAVATAQIRASPFTQSSARAAAAVSPWRLRRRRCRSRSQPARSRSREPRRVRFRGVWGFVEGAVFGSRPESHATEMSAFLPMRGGAMRDDRAVPVAAMPRVGQAPRCRFGPGTFRAVREALASATRSSRCDARAFRAARSSAASA
jgi:hypothetical protein